VPERQRRHRAREVEALAVHTADAPERSHLNRPLDSLGDSGEAEGLREVDDRLDVRIVSSGGPAYPLSGYAVPGVGLRYHRPSVSAERERLSWAEFGVASRELARQVADDGYVPDLILSVARGGLLVGAALGYALDVKNTWTMNVEFYTGVDERLDVPMILPPVPELADLESARMLIADDVADTGGTLALVKDFCLGKVGEVRCAVLYEKSPSVVKCEYVWRRTDLWIDFPWSAEAPVTQRLSAVRA
jgi:uncharacterized protein